MKTDTKGPSESFRKVFTTYLNELLSSTMAIQGTIMTEIWCHPGKTSIIGLLLCLYWQAEYSDAGHGWQVNIKDVKFIFNGILVELQL